MPTKGTKSRLRPPRHLEPATVLLARLPLHRSYDGQLLRVHVGEYAGHIVGWRVRYFGVNLTSLVTRD